MIVDHIYQCYRTTMRLRVDPEVVVRVRWYHCAPGAKALPIETAFGTGLWETDDREYPQPGLGEVGLFGSDCVCKRPPWADGQGTRTPLAWFRDGLPAGFVYPPPHAAVTVTVDLLREIGCVAGEAALLTDEGALAALAEELPAIKEWQWLLFIWPAVLADDTEAADLVEAHWPGYTRLTPTWTDPNLSRPQQATTFASPLSWTRAAGAGAPQTVWGWAAVGPGLPTRLRGIQLLPSPITIVNPGDNVTLCPIQLLLGLCAAGPQIATGGDEDGGTAAQTGANIQRGTGGDEDDGVAYQITPQYAAGGDEDDGTAVQTGAQVGSGGDEDDGTAVQGQSQLATGGDEDDGTAVQGQSQLATGGDEDDGVATQGIASARSLYSVAYTGVDNELVTFIPVTMGSGLSAWSLAWWHKVTADSASGSVYLGGGSSGGGAFGWISVITDAILSDLAGNSFFLAGVADPADSAWHHIALLTDNTPSTKTVDLYIDGSYVGSFTSSSAFGFRVAALGNWFASAYNLIGKLYEVGIWYTGVLTPAKVAALAAGTTDPLTFGPDNLWPFEEGAGTTAVDTAGGNTGTLSGGVAWSADRPPSIP